MIDPGVFKKIRRLEIVSKRLVENVLSGNYLSTFHGTGLEFSDVREYFPGDEVRFIDWNVTARMDRPFLKVYQEERELTVMLAVDVSGSLEAGSQGSSKRELAAQVAAAVGFAAAANQDRVGFLLFSDRVEKYIPPKKGKRHVLRGLREILALDAVGRATDLKAPLARLSLYLRRGAAVFLVSDFLAPKVEEALRGPASRFDLIAARVSDPADAAPPLFAGLLPARDPESGRRFWLDTDSFFARRRYESARRQRLGETLRAFKRLRVDWFEASTASDFTKGMVGFFRRRARR